jgi:hypothetical protein
MSKKAHRRRARKLPPTYVGGATAVFEEHPDRTRLRVVARPRTAPPPILYVARAA